MKPISPVVPSMQEYEIVFAKNQPPYIPLPALPVDEEGRVVTRWRLGFGERLRVLFRGDIYLWISTFKQPLQPVMLTTERIV